MSFKAWLREVDVCVNKMVGCSLHDLEDYMWRDLYDDEFEPYEAAEHAIEEMGFRLHEGEAILGEIEAALKLIARDADSATWEEATRLARISEDGQ